MTVPVWPTASGPSPPAGNPARCSRREALGVAAGAWKASATRSSATISVPPGASAVDAGQHVHRPRHVVQGIHNHRQDGPPGQRRVGRGRARGTRPGRPRPRPGRWSGPSRSPVRPGRSRPRSSRGIRADGDGGPPHAARDVSTRAPALSFSCTSGTLRYSVANEPTSQGRLKSPGASTIVGPLDGDALAGPVRVDELREHAPKGRQRTAEGRHRIRTPRIDQRVGVPGRKGEAPLLLRLLRVVHRHDPRWRPAARAISARSGHRCRAFGELAGREPPVCGQHAVEARRSPR